MIDYGHQGVVSSILEVVLSNPRTLFACAGGLLLSWGATQKGKFLLPSTLSVKARELWTQFIAFAAGLIATKLLWSTATDVPADGWTAGLIVGLLSPALWNLAMYVLSRWKPGVHRRYSYPYEEGPFDR